jgi:protein-L-isoaspartate(D-aspartate) O-methyltransferase
MSFKRSGFPSRLSAALRPPIAFWVLCLFALTACRCGAQDTGLTEQRFAELRDLMVDEQIAARGVKDPLVLKAMRTVPRHRLVPEPIRRLSYEDHPLPIGEDQTISQPYIVALMTELLHLKGGEKVLEVGTGSGYQAAVLAEIVSKVVTIEIVKPLAERATRDLAALGYKNITVICGDGYRGRPEEAPFDAVIVTAAAPKVPQPLIDQLKVGGRLVIPVGTGYQELIAITKTDKGVEQETIIPVRFVPMTGEVQRKK